MNKSILIAISIVIIAACGGVKKTQRSINSGNYADAIEHSLKNLRQNKAKKSHQPYVLSLEEAFKKNTERELQRITFLKNDENPAHYEAIYKAYENLQYIQESIKPLLPLSVYNENRNAKFSFSNYQYNLIDAKDDLSEYLYKNAANLLKNATNKQEYRKAYEDLRYLNEIEPSFDDTKKMMEEAYANGLDYIKVQMTNSTDQIIPSRLEEELLNFNSYGLDNLWTQYHTKPLPNIDYDYDITVVLKQINISPEKISERQLIKEKQVKNGYKYAVDADGSVIKDSLGNKIKIDKFKTVKCDFYQFTQFKAAQVAGTVSFTNTKTRQQLNSYPLSSEFVFEHVYANYEGDKRALENDLVALLNLAAVPFPTNEQMVYDAGEDLKSRLKSILGQQAFNLRQ